MSDNWHDWLSLPHRTGADPRDGEAACCLVMAQVLHEQAGSPFPSELVPYWLELVEAKAWAILKDEFYGRTAPANLPRPLSMALVRGQNSMGIAIVPENGILLAPHHSRGVIAVPISPQVLKHYSFRELIKK
jgi:hypothetical protein